MAKGTLKIEDMSAALGRLLTGFLRKQVALGAANLDHARCSNPQTARYLAALRRRHKPRLAATRTMPACVKQALHDPARWDYSMRYQIGEVLSYASDDEVAVLLQQRTVDGPARHKNVLACRTVAQRRAVADPRPCVTRGTGKGLTCPFGGGTSGVRQCAAQCGYKGDPERVTVSQMWGLAPRGR